MVRHIPSLAHRSGIGGLPSDWRWDRHSRVVNSLTCTNANLACFPGILTSRTITQISPDHGILCSKCAHPALTGSKSAAG